MEDSPLPITKWVPALWFIINHKNGVSSCEVARALGITQKSAWHLCHRIRKAVSNGSFEKLSGNIEIDETYVGGKAKFMHKERREKLTKRGDPNRNVANDKTVVMGILERGGEVRAKVVPNARRTNLLPEIMANVEVGSNIYSDKLRSYDVLNENFNHSSVDHKLTFVDGMAHTNGLENFWCLFKRSVKGTYTKIAPFHTDRYLAEQAFRFNTRKMTDAERFERAAEKIWGKRLMYKELISRKAA
jgi:transposase-like protein